MYEPAVNHADEIRQTNQVIAQAVDFVQSRLGPGDRIYSNADLVDNRVLEFYFPGSDHDAGGDPAAALPQEGGSLFLNLPGGGPGCRMDGGP